MSCSCSWGWGWFVGLYHGKAKGRAILCSKERRYASQLCRSGGVGQQQIEVGAQNHHYLNKGDEKCLPWCLTPKAGGPKLDADAQSRTPKAWRLSDTAGKAISRKSQ